MVDFALPPTVAGYAHPICPHCDKSYGPEVADKGPVECSECGAWFEVKSRTVYQAEVKFDYVPPAKKAKASKGKPRSAKAAKPAKAASRSRKAAKD